ncbi:MAG: zf-HC2 domain-containing protein [Desulfomonile sp.]
MKCLKFQRQISALIDGQLPDTLKHGLERHLRECESCSNVHLRMISANSRLRSSAGYPTDATIAEKVKARIASRRNRRSGYQALPIWGRLPVFATLIMLALGLGNFAGTSLFEILSTRQPDSLVELLVQDNGQYFGDLVMEIGHEDNF